MIRLNQVKDQASELQSHKQSNLGAGYSAYSSGDGTDGLEATLAQLQDGLHHRFGTGAMGNNGLFDGIGATKGILARFSADDAATRVIIDQQYADVTAGMDITSAGTSVTEATAALRVATSGTSSLLMLDAADLMTLQAADTMLLDADGALQFDIENGFSSNVAAGGWSSRVVLGGHYTEVDNGGLEVDVSAGSLDMRVDTDQSITLGNGVTGSGSVTPAVDADLYIQITDDSAAAANEKISLYNTNGTGAADGQGSGSMSMIAENGGIEIAGGITATAVSSSFESLTYALSGGALQDSLQSEANWDVRMTGGEVLVNADTHAWMYAGTTANNSTSNFNYSTSLDAVKIAGNLEDALWLGDIHAQSIADYSGGGADRAWSMDGIPLSQAGKEWYDFAQAFGEVSLLKAITLAGAGGTTDAGSYHLEVVNEISSGDYLFSDDGASGADVQSAANGNGDLHFGSVDIFNSANSAAQVSLAAQTGFGSTDLSTAEILSAVKVYVNGQLLVGHLGTAANASYDYRIVSSDSSGAVAAYADGDTEFAIICDFQLEAGDVIQVFVG